MDRDERHFCITLAGYTFAIQTLYTEVYLMCGDYLSELPPEMRIQISDKDIEYERTVGGETLADLSDAYIETLVVYRKISEALLAFDTILMHGAVVAVGQSAHMFTAPSGTGKTTHVLKWLNEIDGAYVVNGDKPLIRITEAEVLACGTPWCGKERMGTNTMVPLKSIVLMERGEDNHIEQVTLGKAFTDLLKQTCRYIDEEMMRKTLALLTKMNRKVRFFRFTFNNMKDDAVSVAYHALMEGTP